MRLYRRKDWLKYRTEIIELDGGACARCGRSPSEGAVLQIHHKRYLPGKLPWEYPYAMCETLCKGCHAGEHGIVRPFVGWECVGHDDLGDLSGECDLCGTDIRYVFFVQHAKWPILEVGETCCDHLTGTTVANDYMDSIRSAESRQKRFIQSARWKLGERGKLLIHQKGTNVVIEPVGTEFRLCVNGVVGRRSFSSIVEVKKFAFELFENGQMDSFLERKRRKDQARHLA